MVARNELKQTLVDNDYSINIIFGTTFDKMIVGHELTPITTHFYGLIGDSIIPSGKITPTVEMREPHKISLNFIEFLIVDKINLSRGVRQAHSKRT